MAIKPMALDGLKVIELGTHVAIPNVGRAMAECGATVIKIEGMKGEEWRILGKSYNMPYSADENAVFTNQNANKVFVALDLKVAEGIQALKKLISQADVFMTNVRLKSLQKMGLDYESVKHEYPSLIYCHFSGFGYNGPDKDRPGFDMAAFWARSGSMVDWGNPGDFPIKPASGFGDGTVSNIILSGILMALFARTKNGKGTLVSSSLYGSGIWYSGNGILQAPTSPFPKSRYEPANPLSHIYECKDHNWIIITVIDVDTNVHRILSLVGGKEFADDPRHKNLAEIKKDMAGFVKRLNEKFLTKTQNEWAEIFQKNDVVYEKLVHYIDVPNDPQAIANGYIEEVKFRSGNTAKMPRFPVLFSEYDTKKIKPSAEIGCDTVQVLTDAGYTKEQIKDMVAKKAIGIGVSQL